MTQRELQDMIRRGDLISRPAALAEEIRAASLQGPYQALDLLDDVLQQDPPSAGRPELLASFLQGRSTALQALAEHLVAHPEMEVSAMFRTVTSLRHKNFDPALNRILEEMSQRLRGTPQMSNGYLDSMAGALCGKEHWPALSGMLGVFREHLTHTPQLTSSQMGQILEVLHHLEPNEDSEAILKIIAKHVETYRPPRAATGSVRSAGMLSLSSVLAAPDSLARNVLRALKDVKASPAKTELLEALSRQGAR